MSQDNDAPEERARVRALISGHILRFCKIRKDFHMEELANFVKDQAGVFIAPDSPSRILRLLRQEGRLDYVVLSRSKSLYRVITPSE